jgi:N-acetylmuramoyl-L-alanine amidase
MEGVLNPRQVIMTALVAGFTGCSTGPRPSQHSRVPEGRSAPPPQPVPESVERVPEAPRLAPPAASVPGALQPASNSSAEIWIPLARWSRQNGFGAWRRIPLDPEPAYALTTSNGVFSVQISNLAANWDGLEIRLGFEPQLVDNQPFVHALDLRKNVEPLIRGLTPPLKSNGVIVLDPGHGGQNTGAASVEDGVCEKEFTLDWARRLEPLLTSEGWQVFLTRTNDVDVSLADRVAFAAEHQADVFISLHFNSAAPSQEQAGLETYCLTPTGMPSTLTRGYEDDASAVFANNAFDVPNLLYAVCLHRALLPVVGNDRGVRHARFLGVLRGQNRPAVLIEGGYLSNPEEARRIADPAYRQKLAEAIAVALAGNSEPGNQKPEVSSLIPGQQSSSSESRPPLFGLHSSNDPADNR